jgi:hypothetical protein
VDARSFFFIETFFERREQGGNFVGRNVLEGINARPADAVEDAIDRAEARALGDAPGVEGKMVRAWNRTAL